MTIGEEESPAVLSCRALPPTDMDENDPNLRAAFDDEIGSWKARSCADLRAALSGVIAYGRDGPGGPYQVEVQALEAGPDYVHVLVSVCAPHGFVCRPLCGSFIRHADGRLDS